MNAIKDAGVYLPTYMHRHEMAGVVVIAPTAKAIGDALRAEFGKRGMTVPCNLDQAIVDQICAKAPHYCTTQNLGVIPKSQYTIADVRAFLSAVSGTIKSGGVVTQDEAERRTNICMNCPYNRTLEGCSICSGIGTAVFSVLGARKTDNMGYLKQCGVCGCALKAKVWVPNEVLLKTASIQNNLNAFPSLCWVGK